MSPFPDINSYEKFTQTPVNAESLMSWNSIQNQNDEKIVLEDDAQNENIGILQSNSNTNNVQNMHSVHKNMETFVNLNKEYFEQKEKFDEQLLGKEQKLREFGSIMAGDCSSFAIEKSDEEQFKNVNLREKMNPEYMIQYWRMQYESERKKKGKYKEQLQRLQYRRLKAMRTNNSSEKKRR